MATPTEGSGSPLTSEGGVRPGRWRKLRAGLFFLLILLVADAVLPAFKAAGAVAPAAGDPTRYQGGLRNAPSEKKLNDKQLDAVLKSLREKTGWTEMRFDEKGFLTLGDRANVTGGSAAARALIAAAVDAPIAIDLERYDYSSTVAFARLASPVIYQSHATGKTIEVHPLELDFSDFQKLRGNQQVLAAFDVGFVILHELGHAVLGLPDTSLEAGGPGECEDYINRIRRELNLPERQNYIARLQRSFAPVYQRTMEQAELVFTQTAQTKDGAAKAQKYFLNWEAEMVGPIRPDPPVAAGNKRVTPPVTVLANH